MTPAVAETNHSCGKESDASLRREGWRVAPFGRHPALETCQAENPSPFKSSDLQRTSTTTPGGVPQLQQCPRQCSSTEHSLLDPQISTPILLELGSFPFCAGWKEWGEREGLPLLLVPYGPAGPSWLWIWLFDGNPLPEFPFSEAQRASALARSCQRGFQAKLYQTPQLLMGTHSLQLIVCCFSALLSSKTSYKTSMLCASYKTPSRTSVTWSRARALEGGCSNHDSPKCWRAPLHHVSCTGRQSLGFSKISSQSIQASLTTIYAVLLGF